jgi:hypothetical protein
MYCKTCGNKIEEDANFCIKCGNKIGEAYEEIEVSDYFNKDINPSIGIGSNKEWSKIEDALCLVSDRYSFSPCMYSHPSVKDNRVTKDKLMFYGFYANVAIKKLQKIPKSINKLIFGSIDNEIDFINLWHAFKDCGINWDDITQEKTQLINLG